MSTKDLGKKDADGPDATRLSGPADEADATRVAMPAQVGDGEATRLGAPPPAENSDVTRIMPPTPAGDADATRVSPPTPAGDADATRVSPPPVPGGGPDATRLTPVPAGEADATRVIDAAGAAPPGTDQGPIEIGARFGNRYLISRALGIGGMGAVYEAFDGELGVTVALKVIRPEVASDPDAARELERRFKRELLLARQVTHKNVVRIHDMGEIDGIKYITMPYIEGQDLSHLLRREGKLSLAQTLSIMRQALAGLAAAHAEGIVHRDLKPANIMVDRDGQALLMDFGIARSVGVGSEMPGSSGAAPVGGFGQTMIGAVVGTIQYMAPEQAKGQDVDQRADVYAIGLIIRDMLLGPGPQKSAGTAFQELQKRIDEAPEPIHVTDPSIPETISRIVSRCLQPDPAGRYQTAAELLAEIERLDDEGNVRKEPWRLTRRMAAAAAVALVTIVAGTWWFAQTPVVVEPDPVSVLIANFDNQTGDDAFTGTVEQALGVALEGASFVTAFSRDQARRIADRTTPGASVDESMARLISRREGIKVIITGSIARDGSGYRVSATALDPALEPSDTTFIARASVRAASRDTVLDAVNRVGSDLREGLGDTATESARLAAGETFTTGSLEAVKFYTEAQDLAGRGRHEEAVPFYERAIQADQNFGRAFSGLATSLYFIGRKAEAEEQWKKALALMDRMSDREKYRTLGTYNLAIAGNFAQAIDNYSKLVELYPTDLVGQNNLAIAYFSVLDFPKAVEAGRHALDLYPNNVIIGNNYALYAMYAGDFDRAAEQARKLVADDPSFMKNYLPLAIAAVSSLDDAAADDAYEKMAGTGAAGASLAAIGLADRALYRGRWTEAEGILRRAIPVDLAEKANATAADKTMALAETYEAMGRRSQALESARRALTLARQPNVMVPAARLFVRLGRPQDASAIADELENTLQTQNRAYAAVIRGEVALAGNKLAAAVDELRAATKLMDVWLARFVLGVAYVEAGHDAEGLAELEMCQRRRGEASAVFLDDTPTMRYLATLPYWVARAQEGLGQSDGAGANYKKFLSVRGEATGNALVADAGKRLGPGAGK